MKQMNVPADRNLVREFRTVWDLPSLTAAGARLGLTQPAVSHALRRLRQLLGDQLFVRSPGMVPTEAAMRLHARFRKAFDTINRALHKHASFDPATVERVPHRHVRCLGVLSPSAFARPLERAALSVRFETI